MNNDKKINELMDQAEDIALTMGLRYASLTLEQNIEPFVMTMAAARVFGVFMHAQKMTMRSHGAPDSVINLLEHQAFEYIKDLTKLSPSNETVH